MALSAYLGTHLVEMLIHQSNAFNISKNLEVKGALQFNLESDDGDPIFLYILSKL